MYVQFVHLALGNEDGGVQLVDESTCCSAWGFIFDRRKDSGVIYVSSIFNAGRSVCGCMYVYTHTYTRTVQMGYSVVSRNETPRKSPTTAGIISIFWIKEFCCFLSFYLCFFFEVSHEQLSIEEGSLAEAKAPELGKVGGGERYAINKAALRVVDYVDTSM